ncbi:hypothetical protein Patl1_30197 [Pistacia atlantica]|uniref:Uncharacterized protein n=1 Tax=Pistacia atlantica TaxID=434234 RepID=A0ACC1ACB9_9ROSI|nr:hypothetical protein Patl1_30197 [Pistacia atlantica]
MLHNCKVAHVLPRIADCAKNDRNAVLRARCCEYAMLILEHWLDAPEIKRSADLYEDFIRCCVADAMSEVQSIATMCYTLVAKTCPERSCRLFSSFDTVMQRATCFSFSPGPPVFTSPVRPAVVPFWTSPATLQLVAFSSGSSLPTSSPPHFSNRSAELQHQVPDVIEETTPYGESSCVMFSAHKVLKQKKQANVPSLGFGALVSPGREVLPIYVLLSR